MSVWGSSARLRGEKGGKDGETCGRSDEQLNLGIVTSWQRSHGPADRKNLLVSCTNLFGDKKEEILRGQYTEPRRG